MISVIENHGELLPDSVVALKSWLVLASDALLLKDINLGRAMSGSLQDILSRTRTLLENEALQSLLPEKYVEQFVYLLDQCSLASGLIAKLKNLPEGASFADYLQLFKSDQILRNIVPESLLELADFAEKIKTRIERLDKEVLGFLPVYPDQGGYSEKLEWLIEVLSSQRVQRELGPYLDSRWMALFRTPAALMHFFQTYPVEAGALEKLHWIAAQAAASNEARPFEGTLLEPVLLNLQRSLVDGKDVRPVIDMIMKLTDPEAGRFERMKTLLQPIATTENIVTMTSYLTQWGAAVRAGFDLFSWYQTIPPESSWEQTLAALVGKIKELASANSDWLLSGVGLTGKAAGDLKCVFDALTGIRSEWTWGQTVSWLLDRAKESPSGRWYYDRLLEFCLVWQLGQAAQGQDAKKVAEVLQQAGSALRSYLPGISGAAFDKIASVLPLLPGLMALRREVPHLPNTASWITWLNNVVAVAGKSKDPSVRRLIEQIDEFVENVCTDAMLTAFNSLSGAAETLMQDPSAPGAAENTASGAPDFPTRSSHMALVRTIREAGGHVATTLSHLSIAVSQSIDEFIESRLAIGPRRHALRDPTSLVDLLLPLGALGVLRYELVAGFAADNIGERDPAANKPHIIWGDEHVRSKKIWAGAVLAAYWLATSWALYALVKKRRQPSANEPFYSALAADSVQIAMPQNGDPAEGASGGATELGSIGAEQKLTVATDAGEVPRTATGLARFIEKYKGEMAVGGTVLLGAGLTFYLTKNFILTRPAYLDLSDVIGKMEFIDIAESPDFRKIFDVPTQFPSRKILSADVPGNAEENLKRYVSDLSAGLARNTLLRQFFDDLMHRLAPRIAQNKSLMTRVGNEFAFLVELDQMICNMQNYIVTREIYAGDYTHLKAIFILNKIRNYVLGSLIDKYQGRAIDYYSISGGKENFKRLEKFWSSDLVSVYVQYMLHENGASESEIEYYGEVLRIIIEAARLSVTEYTESGGVGFVDEGGVIKLAIDGISERLIYAKGQLSWEKRADARASTDTGHGGSKDSDSVERYTKLVEYLRQASKDLGSTGSHDFIYPGDLPGRLKSQFITERCEEILGDAARKKIIIPVTYKDGPNAQVAMFSLEQIILGVHLKHSYYDGHAEINWPDVIESALKTPLLNMREEVRWIYKILSNIDVVQKHVATLKGANLDGIVAFADKLIKEKAWELSITKDVNFETTVSVTTTEIVASRPGGRREKTAEYMLGQIAFTKLRSRQNMRVSDPEFTELVKFLLEFDFQTSYQRQVLDAREDPTLKSAFDAITLAKVQPLIDNGLRLRAMKYSGYELAGLFAFEDLDGKFKIISLVDNTIKVFDSILGVREKIRRDRDVREWLLGHSIDPQANWAYENGGYGAGVIFPISFDEDDHTSNAITYHSVDHSDISFFRKFAERLYNEADALAKSESEIMWGRILSWLDVLGFFIQLLTAPLSALPAIAISAAAAGIPAIGKILIADDPDEKNGHMLELALGVGIEGASEAAPELLGRFFRRIGSSAAYRRFATKMANGKFGRWLDEVDLPKPVSQGEYPGSLELVRDISNEVRVEKNADVVAKINALENIVQNDPVLRDHLLSPGWQNSFDAGERLKNLLQPFPDPSSIPGESGARIPLELSQLCRDKNIVLRYRSINAWSRLAPDSRVSHLAVVCEIDKVMYVVDPTLFEVSGRHVIKDAVLLEQEWFEKTREQLKGVLVRYKDFPSLDEAKQFGRMDYLFDVDKTEPGTIVLNAPAWFESDLQNYAGLNRGWRVEVDLEGMSSDVDRAYASGADPDGKRYMRDLDGSVYWVKKDVDANTWRVVDPANPTGYAPPIRREISGRLVRHLDLAGKGGAPVQLRQLHLDGANLRGMEDFMRQGKVRALEQLDLVRQSLRASGDDAMTAKLAEALWGSKWSDELIRPQLVGQLTEKIALIKKRVERFDPGKHVDYFNLKVGKNPDGSPRVSTETVAELDTLQYSDFSDRGIDVKYMNAYENGVDFLKSRDDLGSDYMGRVIVHEMTHAVDNAGGLCAVDNAYIGIKRPDKKHDLTALAKLASEPGDAAAKNADSYATFIHYLSHFKKNPQKFADFERAFKFWTQSRVRSEGIEFLFDFNVEMIPGPMVTMGYAVRDSFRNMAWKRASDEGKIDNLIRYAMQLPEARELSYLAGKNTVELSIRNSLQFDFEGERKTRFSWGTTPAVDLEKVRLRIARDIRRYLEAHAHLDSLTRSPPDLVRDPIDAESPETAAAKWILKSSRSRSNEIDEIKRVIADFKNEDLFDPVTIGKVHDRVYRPPAGVTYRKARTADNSLFMSLDVGDSLFVKQVEKMVADPEHAGDQLFATLVRTHPYGDGNGRTARTLYAIHRLRLNEPGFRALTPADEDVLSGLPPVGSNPPNPLPKDLPAASGVVQELAMGSQVAANRRQYLILETGEDFHLGYAAIDEHAAHVTSWRKGEKPLQNQAEDLVVHAGVLRMRTRGLPGNSTAPSTTSESGKKLIFYAPGTYRILDPDLVAAANKQTSSSPDGGAANIAGFKPNEFESMHHSRGYYADGADMSEPSLVYSSEMHLGAADAAVISGISEYEFSHYVPDYIDTERLSLLDGSAARGASRTDILSLTGEEMSIEQILARVSKTGLKYKRVHICVCRELADTAKLTRGAQKMDSAANILAGENSDLDTPRPAHVEGRMITHLVTLLTLDTGSGTIEETVQGAIARVSGEYLEIYAAAGDILSIHDYEQLNWGTAEYWVKISDRVVDESVPGKPVVAQPKIVIKDPQNIYVGQGVYLMYRNGKFTHVMSGNLSIGEVANIVYGSEVQDFNLAAKNLKNPTNSGRISISQMDGSVLVTAGAEVELHNLYRVGYGETLKSVALSRLGSTNYVRQLAFVNVDLLESFDVNRIPVNSDILIERLEETVDYDKEILPGSVLRIPMKLEVGVDLFKQRGDYAYNYLMKQAFGYESAFLRAKLKVWNDLKLLSPGRRIEEIQDQSGGRYIYIAPL